MRAQGREEKGTEPRRALRTGEAGTLPFMPRKKREPGISEYEDLLQKNKDQGSNPQNACKSQAWPLVPVAHRLGRQ